MTASLKLSIASSSYTLFTLSSEGSLSLGEKGVLDHLLEMLTDPPQMSLASGATRSAHILITQKSYLYPQQRRFTFAGIITVITSPLVDFLLGNCYTDSKVASLLGRIALANIF